jgi:hypothetical protein
VSEPKINYLGPASEADIGDRRMNSQWKLVPVEPTETMVINGFESVPDECFTDEEVWEQYQEMSGCQQAAFRAKLCWAAMLASAPEPPPADAGEVARLTAERDALQLRLNTADQRIDELTSAMRSINRSKHHEVFVPGDDEPQYRQRKEWIDWVLSLCDEASASEPCHELPGTSGMRLNMLANQGE